MASDFGPRCRKIVFSRALQCEFVSSNPSCEKAESLADNFEAFASQESDLLAIRIRIRLVIASLAIQATKVTDIASYRHRCRNFSSHYKVDH